MNESLIINKTKKVFWVLNTYTKKKKSLKDFKKYIIKWNKTCTENISENIDNFLYN